MNCSRLIQFPVVVIVAAAISWTAPVRAEELPEWVEFNRDIRPIFAQHCVACHGGVKQAGGLSFVFEKLALAEGESGLPAIAPGDVEHSFLLERVSSEDEDYRMPPAEHGPALSQHQVALLLRWIEQGAKWQRPWSFVPPQKIWPTTVSNNEWCRDALDHYILARLDVEGLKPSPEAERAEWLRRASFALVGLPPTPEEIAAFENDMSDDAYERVVDRQLASPHFGERWASVWLDLARYCDTMGYEKDPHRDIWPYRDWLIRAFNADMPYDEFTIKQLAGDLLPEATIDDRIATAFHRNTQTNTEGGTDDEEFRTVAVIDRVNTTWQVWQATTFGCTQCHSHPYDPIEHHEYYEFLALFNATRDEDLDEEWPRVTVPTSEADWPRAAALDERIGELQREIHEAAMTVAGDEAEWHDLPIDQAKSTGSTQLRIVPATDEPFTEVVAEGTITSGSMYTLEAPLPDGLSRLTAFKIEVLPTDLVAAVRTPELGFVVSRLKAFLHVPGQKPRELMFRVAFCDEPTPALDPNDSFDDNTEGWGDYTKQNFPRFAVFLFDEPLEIAPGGRLHLELKHNRIATGNFGLVIRRGRFSVSGSDEWTALLSSESYASARRELEEAIAEREEIAGTSIPVIEKQSPVEARRTFVFTRGNWLDKGEEVLPGLPAELPPLPDGTAVNRLTMANWMASRENPLTARVMVNRVWGQLFGVGIVETAEDFGTSGALPSHPELLDFLAVRFMDEHRWSVKKLLREIVLSATFRQSSRATPALIERDPRNRLLARGPRQRLRAEMVRDQALMLSGKFSPTLFGPPVMPPQPDGIWRSVYSSAKWETPENEDRYRRALYTYWKRTSPYPSLMAFDAPSRDTCTARRIATNTPLQALVTLNDPAYVELAREFAERIMAARAEPREQIAWAYETAADREPRPAVVDELVRLSDAALAAFDAEPESAKKLADTREKFALTIVANAILNLDEVLTQ
ncbi:MAG: PSD1 and planctomycete cytochrome C domain-containing protein [Pirellulales bacterium]